jgi:hypothetical protein
MIPFITILGSLQAVRISKRAERLYCYGAGAALDGKTLSECATRGQEPFDDRVADSAEASMTAGDGVSDGPRKVVV